jgi:hypothetical protein
MAALVPPGGITKAGTQLRVEAADAMVQRATKWFATSAQGRMKFNLIRPIKVGLARTADAAPRAGMESEPASSIGF